jgi:hypothetical protein
MKTPIQLLYANENVKQIRKGKEQTKITYNSPIFSVSGAPKSDIFYSFLSSLPNQNHIFTVLH